LTFLWLYLYFLHFRKIHVPSLAATLWTQSLVADIGSFVRRYEGRAQTDLELVFEVYTRMRAFEDIVETVEFRALEGVKSRDWFGGFVVEWILLSGMFTFYSFCDSSLQFKPFVLEGKCAEWVSNAIRVDDVS
jgi:hypothetical protein